MYQPRAKAFNGLPPPDDAAETSLPEAKERRAARAAPRLRAIADTRNIIVNTNYKCLLDPTIASADKQRVASPTMMMMRTENVGETGPGSLGDDVLGRYDEMGGSQKPSTSNI